MKITSIEISNFLGARAVSVTMKQPVVLFAGKNGSGKSSVQEAVRMALTGESVRVALKKDYDSLVTEGQEAGFAEVVFVNEPFSAVIPAGAGNHCNNPSIPMVLDAQRFAHLPTDQRRAFLFGLMGLRTDGEAVTKRMLDKGCDPKKVDIITPFLHAGFDAAHKEAQGKARECKGYWKAITGGETYGNVKAASWRAEKPEGECGNTDQAKQDVSTIEAEIEENTKKLGEMQGRARQAAESAGKIAELREKAGKYARISEKLAIDEQARGEWYAKVEATREKAGKAPRAHKAFATCPACNASLLVVPGNRLVKYDPPDDETVTDPEAVAALPEHERALALLEKSVANDKRDLEIADAAGRELKALEDSGLVEAPASESIHQLQVRIDALKTTRNDHQSALRAREDATRKANEADEKTKRAAAAHIDVQHWDTIAHALSQDGIPGEMLAEALGPINERLATTANDAQWCRINIGSDMRIYAAEEGATHRAYALLSESEKWRADAMIAEAVSHLSGVKLLVLDRLDVLDSQGREDLLYWTSGMAQAGEIDTCLLFGTLKAMPAQLPDSIQGVWLENGVAGRILEAA